MQAGGGRKVQLVAPIPREQSNSVPQVTASAHDSSHFVK